VLTGALEAVCLGIAWGLLPARPMQPFRLLHLIAPCRCKLVSTAVSRCPAKVPRRFCSSNLDRRRSVPRPPEQAYVTSTPHRPARDAALASPPDLWRAARRPRPRQRGQGRPDLEFPRRLEER
jgi:hypothetical protein